MQECPRENNWESLSSWERYLVMMRIGPRFGRMLFGTSTWISRRSQALLFALCLCTLQLHILQQYLAFPISQVAPVGIIERIQNLAKLAIRHALFATLS